jgi:hypothetical protein
MESNPYRPLIRVFGVARWAFALLGVVYAGLGIYTYPLLVNAVLCAALCITLTYARYAIHL